MTYAAAYFTVLVVFGALDAVWLTVMGNRLYRATLGDILLPNLRIAPAVAFYFLYPIGIVIFAVMPALRGGSVTTALTYGLLLGFFAYATYDLTNYATLRYATGPCRSRSPTSLMARLSRRWRHRPRSSPPAPPPANGQAIAGAKR